MPFSFGRSCPLAALGSRGAKCLLDRAFVFSLTCSNIAIAAADEVMDRDEQIRGRLLTVERETDCSEIVDAKVPRSAVFDNDARL